MIRGGYGLNYNQEEIAISANVQGNPGLVVTPTFTLSTPTSPNPGIVYATSSESDFNLRLSSEPEHDFDLRPEWTANNWRR